MPSTVVEPRPGVEMGRIVVPVMIENQSDRTRAVRGEISEDQVRRLTVEALVDTGATFMCLPKLMVERLGLEFDRVRSSRTPAGLMDFEIYGTARIEVQGRACREEILALPHGRKALLGQIPLEKLDWWIDVTNRKLVGNPEHDGEWMVDVY